MARAGVVNGDSGVSMSPSGALHSPTTNEVEAFASAVDAIMSSKQQRQQENTHLGGASSLASESLGSTSSGWSGSGNGVTGPGLSPRSSQVSIHSSNSGPQHQMAAILRQSRIPQVSFSLLYIVLLFKSFDETVYHSIQDLFFFNVYLMRRQLY